MALQDYNNHGSNYATLSKMDSNYISTQIGQKLFAYIYDDTQLTDAIKQRFNKSLIFLGYEGQIYNPLTNTYVGIGTTAYTNLRNYAIMVNDKVDALNQALTSSMVSSIYANFDKNDYERLANSKHDNPYSDAADSYTYHYAVDGDKLKQISKKLHATNEIILKGLGDYDPNTKSVSLKEFANVTDANLSKDDQNIITNSYILTKKDSSHATSGITVSLAKGKNKYRFNFIGFDKEKHIFNVNGKTEAFPTSVFIESENILDSSLTSGVKVPSTGEGDSIVYDLDLNTPEWIEINRLIAAYNLVPTTLKDYTFGMLYEPALDSDNNQLYKNGRNEFVIDDTLTWSYISYRTSYIAEFSQKFTTSEVNRIYAEIMGLDAGDSLIPVDSNILYEVIDNGSEFKFNPELNVFEQTDADANDGDGDMLTDIILRDDNVFFKKVYINPTEYTYLQNVERHSHIYTESSADQSTPTETVSVNISAIPALGKDEVVTDGKINYNVNGAPVTLTTLKVYANYNDALTNKADAYTEINISDIRSWSDAQGLSQSTEVTTYIYQGPEVEHKYESGEDDKRYNNNYFLVPVTSLSQVNDTDDYFIINTVKTKAHNLNLADGINTLKEAAYILDIITNGILDPLNPEASGIEMAYSIAQNHIDIVNLDTRLRQVEGGLNVVNNIGTYAPGTNKYVSLNWDSNKVAQTLLGIADAKNADGTFKIPTPSSEVVPGENGYTKFVQDNLYKRVAIASGENKVTDFEPVLMSDVYEWNRLMAKYNADNDPTVKHIEGKSTVISAPVFAEVFGTATTETLYELTTRNVEGLNDDNKYVGDVKLGIDLNLATTYTMHLYGHTNDSDGFIPVTIESINKNLDIAITVPLQITPSSGVINDIESNKKHRYPSTANADTVISDDTKTAINSILGSYGITLSLANIKFEETIISSAGEGEVFPETIKSCKINISVAGTEDTKSTELATVTSAKYTLAETASDSPFDGKLYSAANTHDGEKSTVIAENDELNATTKYYFRYSASDNTVKFADMSDGLTTTAWVEAYTHHAIESLKDDFADAKIAAYNYTNAMITQLDSSVTISEGQVISSIIMKDGKVSVETKKKASDKVITNIVTHGENGSSEMYNYTAITASDYVTILSNLQSTSLYIKSGKRYTPKAIVADLVINQEAIKNENFPENTYYIVIDGIYVDAAKAGNGDDEKAAIRNNVLRSVKLGDVYASYIPVFTEVDAYKLIDNADLDVVVEGSTITSITYTDYSNPIYDDDNNFVSYTAGLPVYIKESSNVNSSKKYLEAKFVQHTIENGGDGENTLHLTAQITKLIDASESNTGFADAYDVRNTLNTLFDWVDLSEYLDPDAQSKTADGQNPFNTWGVGEISADNPLRDYEPTEAPTEETTRAPEAQG